MSEVSKPVVLAVIYIRSHAFSYRQIREFIEQSGETDVPFYTEVQWINCGKLFTPFFETPALIKKFLNVRNRPLIDQTMGHYGNYYFLHQI